VNLTLTIHVHLNQVKSHAQKFAMHHPRQKRNLDVGHLQSKLSYELLNHFQARNAESTSVIGTTVTSPSANGASAKLKKLAEIALAEEPRVHVKAPLPGCRQAYRRRVSDDSTGRQHILVNSDPDPILPTKFDVICALGEAYSVHHNGNRRFQVIIEMNLPKFKDADTNARRLLLEVVLKIIKRSGGRFVQRRPSGDWKVGSDAFALRKIETTFVSFLDAHTFG
jgi:hypothetical protein